MKAHEQRMVEKNRQLIEFLVNKDKTIKPKNKLP